MAKGTVLAYARKSPRRSKVAQRLAALSALIPILTGGMVYIEWLMACWSLGHRPISSLDDPKSIGGSSSLHGITALASVGALPGVVVGIGINLWNVLVSRARWERAWIWMGVQMVLWGLVFGAWAIDVGGVWHWWWD